MASGAVNMLICLLLTNGDTARSVEREVAENILSQKIGEFEVRDLNLPDPFVRRTADRIIRASYHQRYHQVIRDPHSNQPPGGPEVPPAPEESRNTGASPVTSNGMAPKGQPQRQSSLTRPPGPLRVAAAIGILSAILLLVVAGYRRDRTRRS